MTTTYFSKEHEWIRVDGAEGTVGITHYAQGQLGDVVYIDLPEPGRQVDKDEEIAVVESVKAASEVFSPVAGQVSEINPSLESDPSLVNRDAEGEGWFFRLTLSDKSDLDALMDATAYTKYVESAD